MERAAFGLLFFLWTSVLLQLLAPVNAGAGSIRDDARQRGFENAASLHMALELSIGMLFGLSCALL